MAGIIPRHQPKGVDICGSRDYFYIIRSDLGCYMKAKDFSTGLDISIHDLHPACRYGDHYIADYTGFYIIKWDSCRRVSDLTAGTDASVDALHEDCRGGDHYLAAFGWFYIIFQEKGVYRRTKDLSKGSVSDEFPLHTNRKDGLYYWGLQYHFYFLKPNLDGGVDYYKCKELKKDSYVSVLSVHPDVLNFLPGGLSVTNGPVFCRWENIEYISNDSPTPMKWEKKVTKRVGYNKEKMSQITHNWRIETSGSITSSTLARLITQYQFSFSAEYGGASVNTKKEIWTEETEDEEQLSCVLPPNQSLYVWQYQLGLGSEPLLFCRDLKIIDQPNPPTEVPLPSVSQDPALIMEAADTCVYADICDSLFRWLENREECAKELKKLAKELEDVHQGVGGHTSVVAISTSAGFISMFQDLARGSGDKKEDGYGTTFDKAAELLKKIEKDDKKIQEQLQDMRDRNGGVPNPDELDSEVATQLMWALARRSNPFFRNMTSAEDFIIALGHDHSPESWLIPLAKEMVKNIELIGTNAADPGSEGETGLGISLYDLIVKRKEPVMGNWVPKARQFLRDSAVKILDGKRQLQEQLDEIQEIIQKLFIRNNLIRDLGGYSLSMTQNAQKVIDYIKEACTDDRVRSWLQGLPHQTEFMNLLRFSLERLDHILPDLNKPSGDHIDIVIVAHGGIVSEFMPAGGLVPTPNIKDTVLYSPWNCAIDAKAAFAIAQGSIHEKDRAFFNIADCDPIPLPDHWNSMRGSLHDIPVIRLFPVTPDDDAWMDFQQLGQRSLEINPNRVILPYLVPEDEVKAFGEIPLYMFIFAISFFLKLYTTATVHLAACLSLQVWPDNQKIQYAYTSDGACMTVKIDDSYTNTKLFTAFRSMFDRKRR